jgi:predicted site-specific integrase-resolvase
MSILSDAPLPPSPRREAWRKKAERHGVSTKTLDRWATKGIISPPEYINGRKYGNANEEPRTDAA